MFILYFFITAEQNEIQSRNPIAFAVGFLLWLGRRDSNPRIQQSKCCVLPLDDSPIFKNSHLSNEKAAKSLDLATSNGVGKRIRTVGLQGHNLAL